MKHLILGTAGHIDHGKTALIKILTGFDCDTHPEEKSRGITINLGFTHLLLDKFKIGIVDVPGHSDFIHTMVGGASGIDFALLVIAANSGVMPQTIEHLEIMNALNIKYGIIVLNKIDLVDDETTKIAKQEIRELVKGTFLENAPIVPVSASTGQGIEELKKTISLISENIPERPKTPTFRMFIDRIFTVKGFGTVVNGSVISGSLKKEAKVYLLPSNFDLLRIRRIERDKEEVEAVIAGDRASINIVGINKSDFKRGQIISNQNLAQVKMLDAKFTLFKNTQKLMRWNTVLFYIGTFETKARLHILDKDKASANDICVIQLLLDKPCVAMRGDRFIIRNTSGETTLGGGEIIDTTPLHHKRKHEKIINNLIQLSNSQLADIISYEIKKRPEPLFVHELTNKLNVSLSLISSFIKEELPDDITCFLNDIGNILIHKKESDRIENEIIKKISKAHKTNPLEEKGKTFEELKAVIGSNRGMVWEQLLRSICQKLELNKTIKQVHETWTLSSHEIQIDQNFKDKISKVESMFKEFKMQTPLASEINTMAAQLKIASEELKQILNYLRGQKKLYKIQEEYIHASIVDACREALVNALRKNNNGLTVAEFRDLIGGNRKICLLLFAQYDSEGLTIRNGDRRILKYV